MNYSLSAPAPDDAKDFDQVATTVTCDAERYIYYGQREGDVHSAHICDFFVSPSYELFCLTWTVVRIKPIEQLKIQ